MNPSWKVGRIAGISLHLHVTFPLLLVWVGVNAYLRAGRWGDVADGLGFTVLLFAIVVLHELGHALTARRFGIRTRDITLLPIGGLARLDRMPTRAREELAIAVAGPLVNVALAFVFLGVAELRGGPAVRWDASGMEGDLIVRLFWANVSLAAFNLLPAFPMDGGRVLRALLALRLDPVRATDIAALVGRGFAVILAFLGLLANPLLVLIALFVWIGAGEEAGATRLKSALAGVRVEEVMLTQFQVLAPEDTLGRAVNQLLAASQQDFPVVSEGRLVGLLRRPEILAALGRPGAGARVGDVMLRAFPSARAAEPVEHFLARWREPDRSGAVPVLRDGRLVGLFTLANLGEFVSVQLVLAQARAQEADGA
ncbi:MAG: site-2 protease family protein [Opitutaceae bacterium]|nr:site-2 protease family protein [Opitutaceae bacterium]